MVAARKKNAAQIMSTESVTADPSIGLGLLRMMCLPTDMAEIPTNCADNLEHMFASIVKAGQAAVGLRDTIAENYQRHERWKARAMKAEDRLERQGVEEANLEDDRNVAILVADMRTAILDMRRDFEQYKAETEAKHKKELTEVDASGFAQGEAAAEARMKAQLMDFCEDVHKGSYIKGWLAQGAASASGSTAEEPEVSPFVAPAFTPPDKPHWQE